MSGEAGLYIRATERHMERRKLERAMEERAQRRDALHPGEDLAARRIALERERDRLHAEAAEAGPDAKLRARLDAIEDELQAVGRAGASVEGAAYDARFHDDATRVDFILSGKPAPRDYLLGGFLPARESGLIVAQGGCGKGHLQVRLALSLALAEAFGPFEAPKPRGVVLVSVEDDREELHRRFWDALALRYERDPEYGGGRWQEALADVLTRRLRVVDLRGLTGAYLGPDLRDRVAAVVERVEDPGLVLLDPLGRLLPPDLTLNSQEGGGAVVNELDALRSATGCTVLAAHHVNKLAIREGGELRAGAATGSQMLADLARWVLNLKALTREAAAGYGLEPGAYVEAAVTKTNYAPTLTAPLVFRRRDGGALEHVHAIGKADRDAQHALAALLKAGEWLTSREWAEAIEDDEVPRDRARDARKHLVLAGMVERLELREGRRFRHLFAPSTRSRPEAWLAPPATLADIGDRE